MTLFFFVYISESKQVVCDADGLSQVAAFENGIKKEGNMIGTVKQNGSRIEIYDEHGHYKTSISACDGLVGFTGLTVSVKNGSRTELYDENGHYQTSV